MLSQPNRAPTLFYTIRWTGGAGLCLLSPWWVKQALKKRGGGVGWGRWAEDLRVQDIQSGFAHVHLQKLKERKNEFMGWLTALWALWNTGPPKGQTFHRSRVSSISLEAPELSFLSPFLLTDLGLCSALKQVELSHGWSNSCFLEQLPKSNSFGPVLLCQASFHHSLPQDTI